MQEEGRGTVEGGWREGGPLEPEFNQSDALLGVFGILKLERGTRRAGTVGKGSLL